MTLYARMSKDDQARVRSAMLVEAEKAMKGLYPSKAQLRAAARVLVDQALARERMETSSSQGNEQGDEPDAEDNHDHDSGNLGERSGERNQAENPPDESEDQAHDEHSNQK
jgi:hypothetical protein